MALADILNRIDRDAESEAAAIVASAEEQAAKLRADATHAAEAGVDTALAKATHEAEEDARTRIAAARLRGRDRVLAEKRVLIERSLDEAVTRVESMDAAAYAAFLAAAAARVARGDEVVRPGFADAKRLADVLEPALRAAGVTAAIGDASPDHDRGLLLEGDRMSVLVSARALVEGSRSQLEEIAAATLFGGDE